MKKKLKVLVAFSVLTICMSSCVYSLFPIYTEETLIFVPELVGSWKTGTKEGDYLKFESKFGTSDNFNVAIGYGDEDKISDGKFGKREYTLKELVEKYDIGDTITYDSENGRMLEFNDIATLSSESMNYKLSVYENDELEESYEVHLVKIGGDLFMDLYPYEFYDLGGPEENYFPVHTFMKVDVDQDKLIITLFDLDRLNKLFKSNLIRLRHENVDGTMLITAQPKEIQKFLDKYSDDQSVFEEAETYSRIVE